MPAEGLFFPEIALILIKGEAAFASNNYTTTTMLCTVCSQPGDKYCPCRARVYCSTTCQKKDWKSHKHEHERVMCLLKDAVAPREESTSDMMRSPYARPVWIVDGAHAGGVGLLSCYDPGDNTYEVFLHEPPSDKGAVSDRGAAVVLTEHLEFHSMVLDMLFQGKESKLRYEYDKSLAIDRAQASGSKVGPPGFPPRGVWEYGRERMQSEFLDAHVWLELEDGSVYDNISCLAPHTLHGRRTYVRKAWDVHDPEYGVFVRGVEQQLDKVAREMRADGIDTEPFFADMLEELEVQVLTCFRTAVLKRRLLGGGRLCLGSFGIGLGRDAQVMWLHGNGAGQSAAFAPGTAARCLSCSGGVNGPNGKFYAYSV